MTKAAVSSVAGYETGTRNPNARALATLRDVAREHGQDVLADIFGVHRLVSEGQTLPLFRANPGEDVKANIGSALGIAMSQDLELFASLLKAAKPLISRWQADSDWWQQQREKVDELVGDAEREIQEQRDTYAATFAASMGEKDGLVFLEWLRQHREKEKNK